MKRTIGIGSRTLWLGLVWCLGLVVFIALLQFGGWPERASAAELDGARQLPGPQWPGYPSFDYPWQFTGQDHVDLKWTHYSDWPTYKVMRDGIKVAEFGTSTTFYRDAGVLQGQTYTYQICAAKEGYPDHCSIQLTQVTVGEIGGRIWEDVDWQSDHYEITNDVVVTGGVTLDIGSEAWVTGDGHCRDDEGGTIQVGGARLEGVSFYFEDSESSLQNSTLTSGSSLHLVDWHGPRIKGNTFQTSTLSIDHSGLGEHVIVDNSFYASSIHAGEQSRVHVYGENRFYDGAEIMMTGESEGVIEDNQFWDSGIHLSTSRPLTVRYNRFRGAGAGGSAVWISASSPATVEGNTLDGEGARLSDFHTGIFVRGLWPEGGLTMQLVTIQDNAISGWSMGIELLGDLEAEVSGNTITSNEAGIWVDSVDGSYVFDPVADIHGNCIAGNGCTNNVSCGGLTTIGRVSDPLNAMGNYWGHASGPTHPDNPSGQGDEIDERGGTAGLVDYSGWLQSHECTINDLSVGGVEVVQVVQELNNSVPLVAGKPTVVRVYADSFLDTMSAPVELNAYRDGTLLGSLNGVTTASPITDWDAVRSEPDLTFQLPEQWLSGEVSFTVKVNPQHTIKETTYDNNEWSKELAFASKYPLNVNYLPIKYGPEGSPAQLPDEQTILQKHGLLEQILPYYGLGMRILPPFPVNTTMQVYPEFLRLFLALFEIRSSLDRGLPRSVVGPLLATFPDGSITLLIGGGGVAPGDASKIPLAAGLALNLRIPKADRPCGDPDSDAFWPYPDATIQEYGYDHAMDQVVPPSHYDLVSLCTPRWISPYHYGEVFVSDWGQWPPPTQAAPTVDQTYLLVSGLVYTDSTAAFSPFWQITSAYPPDNYPADGFEYCLELRDAGDAVLADHCFNAEWSGLAPGGEADAAPFVAGLPLDPNAAKVVLRQGSTILGQVTASAHAPTVTLDTPNGGESPGDHIVVQWTAQDVDPGDELTYDLWYSHDDGATWLPVAAGLTGTTSYDLDLSWVPGGTNARMRVEVSDGFHTASDDSDGTFSVPEKAPWVLISHPQAGTTVVPPLTLRGMVYDLEEGELEGAALVWTSDLDGQLGTGATLPDVTLSPGVHVLTLTAIDGQGLEASDAVTVTVEAVAHEIYLPLVQRQP